MWLYAAVYSCKQGAIPRSLKISFTKDNSKDGCAAACNAVSECAAFDFTVSTSPKEPCRLATAGGTPDQDAGNHNRQFCSLAGKSIGVYSG